jgi:MFS family permease
VRAARRNLLGEIGDGLSYVRGQRVVLALVVFSFVPMVLGFSYQLLMPVFVVDALKTGSVSLGVFMTIIGVGALVGSFAVAAVSSFRWQQILMVACALGWGALIVVFALAPNAGIAAVPLVLLGLTGSVYMVLANSFMMVYAAPEMRGRVTSILMTAHGLMPVALLPISGLSDAIGVRQAFVGSGLLAVLAVGIIYALMPALRRLPPLPYGGMGIANQEIPGYASVSPAGTAPPRLGGV